MRYQLQANPEVFAKLAKELKAAQAAKREKARAERGGGGSLVMLSLSVVRAALQVSSGILEAPSFLSRLDQ